MTDVTALLREVSVEIAAKEGSLLVQKQPSNQRKNFLSDLNKGRQTLDLEMQPRPIKAPESSPLINDKSPTKSPSVL